MNLKVVTIVLICLAILTSCSTAPSQTFRPSECFVLDGVDCENNFPLTKEQIVSYIESQYIRGDETAGFSLVINSPDDYHNLDFAYYIISLLDIYDMLTVAQEELLAYKTHFEKYEFDFSTMELEEIYRVAFISTRVHSEKFRTKIKTELAEHYSEKDNLYFYYSDDNVVSMFGATYLIQKINAELNSEDEHIVSIRNAFQQNIERYTDSTKQGEFYENFYNLLLCSGIMNVDLQFLNIDFTSWLQALNENLSDVTTSDYLSAYSINQVYQINKQMHFSQEYVLNAIRQIGINTESLSSVYNNSSSLRDIIILTIEKDLCVLEPCNESIADFITSSLNTNFIQRNTLPATPMYTFYGVVLSDVFGFSYDAVKVKRMIMSTFVPEMLNGNNIGNSNYIIDSYFTAILSQYFNCTLEKEQLNKLNENINSFLSKQEYTDLTKAYENLYSLQFSLEISKIFEFDLENSVIRQGKNYIHYLANNNIFAHSSRISEVRIVSELLQENLSSDFESTYKDTIKELYNNGGFSSTSSKQWYDLITTAKIYRTESCTDKEKLKDYLNNFIVGDNIAPDGDITVTDLRYYYNFYRLWILAQ